MQQFGLYNAVTFILALVLGRFARFLVQHFDIHHRYELLRLHNKWWYLFNGYYLTAIGYEKRYFDLLFVDAMVSTNEGTLIYSGYLVEFVCTGEELDRIYLNDATRRKIKSKVAGTNDPQLPDPESSAPVVIPGQLLSIPYREIRNLNLRFINLELSLEEIEALPNDFDIPTEEELHDLDEAEADLF